MNTKISLAMSLIILSCNAWGMGQRPPTSSTKKFPRGYIFTERDYNGSSYQDSKRNTQYTANYRCRSGNAVRITPWSLEPYGRAEIPGDCRIINHQQYCTPNRVVHLYPVSATFRCE